MSSALKVYGSRSYGKKTETAGLIGSIPGNSQLGLDGKSEPILLHINNATNAGTLDYVSAVHCAY
jgi:hypothetical protein